MKWIKKRISMKKSIKACSWLSDIWKIKFIWKQPITALFLYLQEDFLIYWLYIRIHYFMAIMLTVLFFV